MEKKLSIIITVQSDSEDFQRCLGRIEKQSYKNIEVILINDTKRAINVDGYDSIFKTFKYIQHDERKDEFYSKIEGIKIAEGDYITFINPSCYPSIDYYRSLIEKMNTDNLDIGMGKVAFQREDESVYTNNLLDCKYNFTWNNEQENSLLEMLIKQKGLNFDWYIAWNKIYKRDILKSVLEYTDKINTTSVDAITCDMLLCFIEMIYAQKIGCIQNDVMFYCKNEYIKYVLVNNIKKEYQSNFIRVGKTFEYIKNILIEKNIYEKYADEFIKWKQVFTKDIIRIAAEDEQLSKIEKKVKKQLLNVLMCDEYTGNVDGLYNVHTEWNSGLESLKWSICDSNIECVSFDVFDTLIQRPFYYPTDLFELMSDYFLELTGNKTNFSYKKMRINCEESARKRKNSKSKQVLEVTIDEIYKEMQEIYYIDEDITKKLKEKEIELELKYCKKREVGYELFMLAKAYNKRIIITSDMYLSKDTIEKILELNGYNGITRMYVSSELMKSKAIGTIYQHIIESEKVDPSKIIHIGDNYHSDFMNPKKYGINSFFLVKALDIANDTWSVNNLFNLFNKNLPEWMDNTAGIQFFGIRTMLSIIANKYFDNPFRTFNKESDFNADPFIIGYYALGMYLFGLTKWLLDDLCENDYEKIVFMARDRIPTNTSI